MSKKLKVMLVQEKDEYSLHTAKFLEGYGFDVVTVEKDGAKVADYIKLNSPDVLLMDEPTSALDPIATAHIEELMQELQKEVTILIVTHNMGQAMRISSKSMFMYLGELVEYDDTQKMFSDPKDERTKAYLTGKMG